MGSPGDRNVRSAKCAWVEKHALEYWDQERESARSSIWGYVCVNFYDSDEDKWNSLFTISSHDKLLL